MKNNIFIVIYKWKVKMYKWYIGCVNILGNEIDKNVCFC